MKKTGLCINCGREVYTNDLDLCKRCYQEVGLEFLQQKSEEAVEEAPKTLEELGLVETEEPTEAEKNKEA